jgi:hypothetical protein
MSVCASGSSYLAQCRFNARVARPQHGKLASLAHQFVHHGGQQVKAFLLGQAADHGEHQRVGGGIQSHAVLEPGFGQCLARQVVGVEAGLHQCVGRRVPHGIVHAIEDAVQLRTALAQHAIQATTLLDPRDFMGVGGAHRGDGLAVLEPGFHE